MSFYFTKNFGKEVVDFGAGEVYHRLTSYRGAQRHPKSVPVLVALLCLLTVYQIVLHGSAKPTSRMKHCVSLGEAV